ncbi:hypothetical protein [Dactylosporangium sp. CA-139066]|uniref:hypothetical protein n=1 Tax=Dactylosporangium sp. CA-139066 TaxID=3239930 RepID=UPI003D91923E
MTMTMIVSTSIHRPMADPAPPVSATGPHGLRQLPCRVVGMLLAAAVFAFVAGQPLTARPPRALAELLADSTATGHSGTGSDRVQLHTPAAVWAGAAGLRLARTRRVATAPPRTRTGTPAGRRRRRGPEEPLRAGETSATETVRPTWRRWLRRIGICGALLAGLLLVPAVAHADPTPAPPSPSAPAQPPTTAACGGGDLPADQQRWCFGWAVYTANPAKNAVSHWTTACSRTKSPDELATCQTVSLEFTSKPKDGARATLADVPVGTKPVKDMVGCKQFTAAAQAAGRNNREGLQEMQVWLAMASRCDAIAAALLPALGSTVAPPPPKADEKCDVFDQQCKIDKAVGGAVERGIDAGIQGVINLIVQGVAVVLAWLASQVFTQTSIGAPDDAFYLVYNSTAGIMLIFVFVLFIISAIINTLRFNGGPSPLASVGGLVRAVIGIVFAGGIAWLIVTAWDQATNALLAQNDSTAWDASIWITALTNLSAGAGTGAIALVAGLFSLIGLLFLFIIMLFRGMLTTAAAVFGAVAMAGQASHETRSWGRRWFWTVNALAMSKFAIAALWIYGTRAAYGSNDITTVLQAVLIIWLMVLAPGILLRLTAIWDGYLADANGRGFATAAAAGIGDLAGRAADSLMDRRNGGGDSSGGNAAEVMADNVADMDDAGSNTDTGADDTAVEGAADTAGELTEDAGSNESGEPVGAVDSKGGPAAGDDGGTANSDEADAIADNAAGAQTDVAAATHDLSEAGKGGDQDGNGGGVQVPTDPTGASGTEQTPGADDTTGNGTADPNIAGSSTGAADAPSGGQDGAASPPSAGDSSGPAGAGATDPDGGASPAQPAGAPAGADGGGSGSATDAGAGADPPSGGAPAGGEGAAGAGGAGGGSSAAAAAAV